MDKVSVFETENVSSTLTKGTQASIVQLDRAAVF